MIEYIEETPPTTMVDNICNESQAHTHVHRLWGEFALYIVVLLTSRIFIVFDVSATIFVLKISYINPLNEIVINYQNGRD
jgi:hypothetical protein